MFVGLAGLPRSGSTLLSCLLDQNPDIHAPGNSPVCQLMWNMYVSVQNSEQILATKRQNRIVPVLTGIVDSFYGDRNEPIVVDKCRAWTLPENMFLMSLVNPFPKVLVLVRPLHEVVASLLHIGALPHDLLTDGTEIIMRPYEGIRLALEGDTNKFLFISYANILKQPQVELDRISTFLEIDQFSYSFEGITNNHPEDDFVYRLPGMHDVRPCISQRTYSVNLSDSISKRCYELSSVIDEAIKRADTP